VTSAASAPARVKVNRFSYGIHEVELDELVDELVDEL